MKQTVRIFILAIITISFLFTNQICSQGLKDDNQSLDENIKRIRKGTIYLKGKPGETIHIRQVKHEFWFGCAISSGVFSPNTKMSEEDIRLYKEKFLENFNSAVTENAVKWGSMERKRGEIDYETSENILEFTDANGLPCRGHNLYWGIDQFIQPWVKDLNNEELRETLEIRGRETALHFKGRFVEYDLNNEMIHGNYYSEKLGEGITLDMAKWVLEGDPDAKLWVNDYDILTGNRLDDYIKHIRKLIDSGVPVAGIGVQGHLHKETFSRDKLKESLDALGEFGLPIRITEFNIPGQRSKYYRDKSLSLTMEEEELKAKELTDYYRICFAHPAVDGILMWGFWEGANWIRVSSLYKKDWTPTPALMAYQDLIFKEWNTTSRITLNEKGKASVPAFYGDYKIETSKGELDVSLAKSEGSIKVDLSK